MSFSSPGRDRHLSAWRHLDCCASKARGQTSRAHHLSTVELMQNKVTMFQLMGGHWMVFLNEHKMSCVEFLEDGLEDLRILNHTTIFYSSVHPYDFHEQ